MPVLNAAARIFKSRSIILAAGTAFPFCVEVAAVEIILTGFLHQIRAAQRKAKEPSLCLCNYDEEADKILEAIKNAEL